MIWLGRDAAALPAPDPVPAPPARDAPGPALIILTLAIEPCIEDWRLVGKWRVGDASADLDPAFNAD